jgi:ParD-like antitoxin of type II bacterial toxin-antitoxin system
MSQPVKLSDSLVLDARLTAEIAQRSIAGQIEFWASLGRAVEGLLRGREVLALRKADAARLLSECLDTVDSPEGRQRVAEYLRTRPFPHYEAAAGHPRFLVCIDGTGPGRLVDSYTVDSSRSPRAAINDRTPAGQPPGYRDKSDAGKTIFPFPSSRSRIALHQRRRLGTRTGHISLRSRRDCRYSSTRTCQAA